MAGPPSRPSASSCWPAQQLGVALGLAVLTTAASATSQRLLDPGSPPDQAALTSGYAAALRGAALIALAAAVLALLVLPSRGPSARLTRRPAPEEPA